MSWLANLLKNKRSPTSSGDNDIALAIAEYCRNKLDLSKAHLSDEYRYRSLPLCVIDAVFSINARYTAVENVVARFCRHFGLQSTSRDFPPRTADQLPIAAFIGYYNKLGVDGMTTTVYQNRQRTSTTSGILKSEAVLRFSQVLQQHGVNYIQDVAKVLGQEEFESAIRQIPGQRSGLSLRYFYMLAGSDDLVKPDRMIMRFILAATGKTMSMEAAHSALIGTCRILQRKYPKLTPRLLDHAIWEYQRSQGAIG